MSDSSIQSRPVVPSDWPAIERLFGRNGACGGCWCMLWRVPSLGRYWERVKGEPNKAAFQELVKTGKALGCLAWTGDEPVGWCGMGPRHHFQYLARSRSVPSPDIDNVWVVSCFFITRSWRGRGVARQLLTAALDFARSAGAAALEGYPTVPKSSAAPIPPAFAHTGVPRMFEAAGFERVRDIGARQVWRCCFEVDRCRHAESECL